MTGRHERSRCTSTGTTSFRSFKGEEKDSPREGFLYWSDDGDLMAIRVKQWKVAFMEQEHTGLDVWKREFTNLRAPNIYNLRADPFERGTEGIRVRQLDGRSHVPDRAGAGDRGANGWRASRSSRRGRSPRASTSTR